jgi:hypothetical protein
MVRSDQRRFAADLYMLGNLFMFLLTGISHSGFMYGLLDRSQHWTRWGGSFTDVLPALTDCHGIVLGRLDEALHSDIRQEAVRLINELCYCDPTRRGDAVARRQGQNPFGLQRYIARLDLMHRRAAIAGGVKV